MKSTRSGIRRRKASLTIGPRIGMSGQSTIEYVLMLGFGVMLSVQIAKFLNGVFRDGLTGLERNVQAETETGRGFGQSSR